MKFNLLFTGFTAATARQTVELFQMFELREYWSCLWVGTWFVFPCHVQRAVELFLRVLRQSRDCSDWCTAEDRAMKEAHHKPSKKSDRVAIDQILTVS